MATINDNVREAMHRGATRALNECGYKTREELLKEAEDLGFIERQAPAGQGNNTRPQ